MNERCAYCDSEKLSIEIRGKRRVQICDECGGINAGEPNE